MKSVLPALLMAYVLMSPCTTFAADDAPVARAPRTITVTGDISFPIEKATFDNVVTVIHGSELYDPTAGSVKTTLLSKFEALQTARKYIAGGCCSGGGDASQRETSYKTHLGAIPSSISSELADQVIQSLWVVNTLQNNDVSKLAEITFEGINETDPVKKLAAFAKLVIDRKSTFQIETQRAQEIKRTLSLYDYISAVIQHDREELSVLKAEFKPSAADLSSDKRASELAAFEKKKCADLVALITARPKLTV
jgi:hypothetical protein